MRIYSPSPQDEIGDPPRLRDFWPLLMGPLIFGAVVFWIGFFVHLVRGTPGPFQVIWTPAQHASEAPTESGR